MYIGIGGCCMSGCMRKNVNITCQEALPFDFIITKFSGVIEIIKNDFNNFLPNVNTLPTLGTLCNETKIYYMSTHGFYHHNHNLLEQKVRDAFERRIERFKKLLTQQKEVIFFRFIGSRNISDETNLKDLFLKMCLEKYPELSCKIIFIGFGNQNISEIFYENLENSCYLFIVPRVVDDEQRKIDVCSKVIYFFDNNVNLLSSKKSKLIIDSDNLSFFETELDFSDENLVYLDHCHGHDFK